MSYCDNCGAQTHEGQSFCAGCGASVSEANAPTQQSTEESTNKTAAEQKREAALQKLATLNAQAPPPTKSSGKKILIAVLAVFLVGAIAAVAGVAYVGYRVKRKAGAALDNLEGKRTRTKSQDKLAQATRMSLVPEKAATAHLPVILTIRCLARSTSCRARKVEAQLRWATWRKAC